MSSLSHYQSQPAPPTALSLCFALAVAGYGLTVLIAAGILGTFAVLSLLLFVADQAERRVVSEPVLIARVVRAPKLSPEYVEAFVASRAERILNRP